ncbi:ATP-dependent metallopeptidase FtsH/Yme1/Tma family protein [candidate division KSB1 bacterium]|nr:ATP-dependent metallopeptidase FtsH/Yme1/Tma family protein [candidate division KSB1 bacterium]
MNEQKRMNQPPTFNWGMVIWLMILFFIISSTLRYFKSPKSITLTYSEFKDQLKQNNIADVTIEGQKISGDFRNEYVTTDKQARQDSIRYNAFNSVLLPMDDQELPGLLESHNVEVTAKTEGSSMWRIVLF